MYKKPSYYRMKYRSREDIVNHIINITRQRTYHYDPYWLCYNVKVYDVDLSFSNMLKLWREYEGERGTHELEWLADCKAKYENFKDCLWDWGVGDASEYFHEKGGSYHYLWCGKKIDVDYAFVGRSGGWLAIVQFEGTYFNRRMDYTLDETLKQMDFDKLKDLYQLVVMLKHDLREEAIKSEVEHQASFTFFANICDPAPRDLQPMLFDTGREELLVS